MVDDSLPQWIRTYPEDAAPRTGDGLFPGEVIEVTQVRVCYTYADWVCARSRYKRQVGRSVNGGKRRTLISSNFAPNSKVELYTRYMTIHFNGGGDKYIYMARGRQTAPDVVLVLATILFGSMVHSSIAHSVTGNIPGRYK